jgi:spore coat protein U-like protein
MKRHLALAVLASLAAIGGNAFADTSATANFTVKSTLTSKCINTTSAAASVMDFGAYAAFGAQIDKSITLTFKCTRGLTMTAATLSASAGQLNGVEYTLALASTTGSLDTAGVAPTGPTDIGTADLYSFQVDGSMAAGQAGTAGLASAPDTRTLTINF